MPEQFDSIDQELSNELAEHFTVEPDDAVQELLDIDSQREHFAIDTQLFSASFFKVERFGTVVDGGQGILLRSLFDAFADKLVMALAQRVVFILGIVADHEKLAAGEAPSVTEFFEEDGKLRDSIAVTAAQHEALETAYAELMVYNDAIKEVAEEYANKMSHTNTGLQFGYVSSTASKMTDGKFEIGPIYRPSAAIRFRVQTAPSYRAIINQVRRRKEGVKEIAAITKADLLTDLTS